MPHVRRKLKVNEVSLCGDPANPDARVALFKAHGPRDSKGLLMDKIDIEKMDFSAIEDEDIRKSVAEAVKPIVEKANEAIEAAETSVADVEKERDEIKVKLEDAEKQIAAGDDDDGGKKPIDKSSMSEADKAKVEALEKQAEEAAEKSKADEERIAKLEDVAKTAELTTLAKSFTNITYETDALVGIIKTMDESKLDEFKKFLKATDEQIRTAALFAEKGGAGETGEAYGTIQAMAKELMGEDSSLTKEQAFTKIYESNPELRVQEKREAAEKRARAH